MLVNVIVSKLSHYSAIKIILVFTISILLFSIPLVYVYNLLFGDEYTYYLFYMSIVLPTFLTPPAVFILLRAAKSLKHVQQELAEEVEKNKKNDILLFEQARFALMGEMLANISHQWKQPLNTMGISLVALQTANHSEEERNHYYEIMESNIHYLANTIDDFMSFFDHKTSSEMRTVDSVFKEIQSIISTQIASKGIDFDVKIDESHGSLLIASSISQVILNLLGNSKDAFEKDQKHKKMFLQLMSTEYGMEIKCCDNGKGISEDIKDKIFEPYFTTKEKRQGSGLGLYMTKEIVQKFFGGKIALDNREFSRSSRYPAEHKGLTCFYIAVPYSDKCELREDINDT